MTELKVAWVANAVNFLPWWVGMDKGIFEKYNLKVSGQLVAGGATATRAMVSGEYQFISSLGESAIAASNEGAGVKIIGALNDKAVFQMLVQPNIKSMDDLKGKKIAINEFGSGMEFQTRYLIKQFKMEPMKDITIISAGDVPKIVAGLKSGQVEAGLLSPPTIFQAEEAGMKVLFKVSDILKTYNHEVIVTTDKLIKEKPEVVRAFMKATGEAIEWIRNNKAEATEIGAKYSKATPEIAKKSFDILLDTFPTGGKANHEGIQWDLDAMKEAGAVKKELKLTDIADYSFEPK